jgi:hypothetical protein
MESGQELNSDFASKALSSAGMSSQVSFGTTRSLSMPKLLSFAARRDIHDEDDEENPRDTAVTTGSVKHMRSVRSNTLLTARGSSDTDDRFNPIHSLGSLSVIEMPASTAVTRSKVFLLPKKTIWRPICAQGAGILLGWIYLIIPSENYWVKVFLRNQWFSLLVVVGYTELEDTCMPDTSTAVYIWVYILGFFLPPILRVVAWVAGVQDNYFVNTFIPATPCFVVWLLYGYDAVARRVNSNKASEKSGLIDTFLSINSDLPATTNIPLSRLRATNSDNSDDKGVGPQQSMMSTMSTVSVSPESLETITYDGFFKFLPRFVFYNASLNPRTCGPDRLVIWAFASSFILMWVLIWEFVMNFTLIFRQYANSSKTLELLFVIFVVINNLLRMILKRVGLRNDLFKQGTTSMFFVAETLCLLFYYTFYRVLFQSVDSWSVFLILQLLHLSFEWLCYPFRASRSFLAVCTFLASCGGVLGATVAEIFGSKYVSYEEWKKFIALDFGIRVTIVLSSGIAVSVYLLSISEAPWELNSLKENSTKEHYTIMWIGCAVGLELLNAWAINSLFFSGEKVSVYEMLLHAYADDRFFFLTAIISAIMFLNPVYAFTTGT